MAELTEHELYFLYSQRIDESAVMDCSWMRSHGYKQQMEREGYLWCIAPNPATPATGSAAARVIAYSATRRVSLSSNAITTRHTST